MEVVKVDSFHSWIIVIFCFALCFLSTALWKIAGLIYVMIMDRFNVNRKAAALPCYLSFITSNIAGPIAGYLGHKFGLKNVILSGSIIFSSATGCCFFATDLLTLNILWGGIAGFGMGLVISLMPQVINVHFKKHFSKANGLSLSGSPVAGLALAPVVEYLLFSFNLPGVFLILCGILLHSIPASLMLKHFKANNMEKRSISDSQRNPIHLKKLKSENTILDENNDLLKSRNQFIKHENIALEANNSETVLQGNVESNISSKAINCTNIKMAQVCNFDANYSFVQCLPENQEEDLRKSISERSIKQKNIIRENYYKPFMIFCNLPFTLIALSWASNAFLLFSINAITVDFGLDKGLSIKESTYLVMALNSFDVLSRIFLGFITDSGYMTRANFCSIAFFTLAVSFLFVMWSRNFTAMILSLALQGVPLGNLISVLPGLIPQYIEKDQHVMAMGSLSLYLLPFNCLGPTLIGYFRDTLGSYNSLMYIFALIAAINGFCLLLLPYWNKCKKTKTEV